MIPFAVNLMSWPTSKVYLLTSHLLPFHLLFITTHVIIYLIPPTYYITHLIMCTEQLTEDLQEQIHEAIQSCTYITKMGATLYKKNISKAENFWQV